MSRAYKSVRPKKDRVYSVDHLMALYGVSRNTVSNWVKTGLSPSDKRQPYVFRGAIVAKFHKDRRERAKSFLFPGEFSCWGCKAAVTPPIETIAKRNSRGMRQMLFSACPECGAQVRKWASEGDLAILDGNPFPSTNKDCRHEEKTSGPVGIGKSAGRNAQKIHLRNDRVILTWQVYAKRFNSKTQDLHLAAIRQFEVYLNGKSFRRLTRDDVSAFRDHQRDLLSCPGKERRSKSSVSHTLSHVRDFLIWFGKQDQSSELSNDLADYLRLSKSEYAAPLQSKKHEYPSIEKAETMLHAMPSKTLIDRRSRAIFAIAFLGALRAGTIASLSKKHVDIANKKVIQDATVVRAKNGKSLNVFWFPLPDVFKETVVDWVNELAQLGFGPDDALFPSCAWFEGSRNIRRAGRATVEPMATSYAVTVAFREASKTVETYYTPHSAKHTIAALRDERPLTQVQRKAWSENMGHDNEQITDRNYGKLSDGRRAELFEEIRLIEPAKGHDFPLKVIQMMEELTDALKAECRKRT